MRRSDLAQYGHVTRLVTALEEHEKRVLWLCDHDPGRARSSSGERRPDLSIDMLRTNHLEVALLMTHLIAQELVRVIILEGIPPNFENHYLRLRWICAHFESRLIIFTD